MTTLAPASFSISAPMSPVWWPEASVWQSCPADGDAGACPPDGLGDQGCWRANEDLNIRLNARRHRGDRFDLREVSSQPVHFPISGDQRAHVVFRREFSRIRASVFHRAFRQERRLV